MWLALEDFSDVGVTQPQAKPHRSNLDRATVVQD
jgi:hypothetical protein